MDQWIHMDWQPLMLQSSQQTGQFYEQSRSEKLIACYYNGSGLLTHSGQTFFWNPWQFDAHAQRGPMFFLATAVLLS